MTNGPLRIAVVTPYFREADDILRQGLESVRGQSHQPVRHFVVADGFPNRLVDEYDVRHIVLPTAHNDNGNLARCIGAIAAVSEGFDGVAFLDADNWFRLDHIEQAVALHLKSGAALVTAGRTLHRDDDGSLLGDDLESDGIKFADTSCLCFFRPAFDLLSLWGMMPPEFGSVCDRVMWAAVLARNIGRVHNPERTVACRSKYQVHYRSTSRPPPAGMKSVESANAVMMRYWKLPPLQRISMLTGVGGAYDLDALTKVRKQHTQTRSAKVAIGTKELTLQIPDDEGTRYVTNEIFVRSCYRPPSGSPRPKAILDIGANVGLAAAYFRLTYPDAMIVCVEPDALAYDFLVANSKTIGNCHALCLGLSDATHATKFHLGNSTVLNSKAAVGETFARALFVSAKDFLGAIPPTEFDLIKIDTEGAELPILLGLRHLLDRIGVIHLEFHSHSDRRLIDELLAPTHILYHGEVTSPHRGQFSYVLRSHGLSVASEPPLS